MADHDEREALARLLHEKTVRGLVVPGGTGSWDEETLFTEQVKESWRREADWLIERGVGFRHPSPATVEAVADFLLSLPVEVRRDTTDLAEAIATRFAFLAPVVTEEAGQ